MSEEKKAPRRITVTGSAGSYGGDQHLIASTWARDENGGLAVIRDHVVIAQFEPGWGGVIDEDHRDPGYLKIAREGLSEVMRLIRKAEKDGEGVAHSPLVEAIFAAASDAHAGSYPEVPF